MIVLLKPGRGHHGRQRSTRRRRTRRTHLAEFKATVAVAAIKGDKTLAELFEHFDIHPNQISEWKQQLLESAAEVFGGARHAKTQEPDVKVLHPGPVNRGVEISSDLMDDPQFSLISQQVTSGVAVRMAVLFHVTLAEKT